MEFIGAIGIGFMFFISVSFGIFILDTRELIIEDDLRTGKEVLVSNGDKYICQPTELTVKKLELEKAIKEYVDN